MNLPSTEEYDRYSRLRALVDRADELPIAEWPDFVGRECPSDPALRAEALRLLEQLHRARVERFLEHPASATVSEETTEDYRTHELSGDSTTSIGKYAVVRRFDVSSGQAAAYLALDPDLERHVVLKRYHGDPGEIEEGRALAKVASPFVARCYGIERIEGESYLVVEYIPGRNLNEVRRDGPMDPARVVGIVANLAEGVAAVHARGLIHRDIKPANVILHDDGRPRLVDFGLAAHLGSPRLHEIAGSPSYMAPEQARGHGDRIDHRVDIFGLGGVLYALLTGRPLYHGPDLGSTLKLAEKAEITPPRRLDPKVPAPIEAVCLKALALAPENRHGTALEFARALERARLLVRVRRLLPAAGAAILLLVAAAWLWPKGAPPPPAASVPIEARTAAAGPIAVEIAVTHYRDRGAERPPEPVGVISEQTLRGDPPRLKDLVRVRATLSRPAYTYLIAVNPDGKDQLCFPAGGRSSDAPCRDLDFPEDPKDYFWLTDGAGVQAFVLVASDRPLPAYDAWKSQIPGGLAWSPPVGEALWTYDGSPTPDPAPGRGRVRGDIVRRQAAPAALVTLCERLRRSPGVSTVHAVAFPVKSDQEILK
jgi:serine/threonine protein kinase